ncbi:MAG: Bax inhibitor-1 family protein, partial [Oligosphaeraceae bacterium]
AGLTAYDTQKLKNIHETGFNHTGIAVLGALSLYLDFINLFLYLLRLLGRRK